MVFSANPFATLVNALSRATILLLWIQHASHSAFRYRPESQGIGGMEISISRILIPEFFIITAISSRSTADYNSVSDRLLISCMSIPTTTATPCIRIINCWFWVLG